MKKTSPFSASMIGVRDEISNPATDIYVSEGKEVSQLLSGVHHARKISHLQVYYPETIQRLTKLQSSGQRFDSNGEIPGLGTQNMNNSSQVFRAKNYEIRATKLKDFHEQMNQHVVNEKFINFRKKEFNRESGRKAVVNQVLAGTAPMPNSVLFPTGATHEQILAITGKLKAPSADIVPPEVPRQRKWKGNGWGA